jgi:two-component system, sensor histidine kinase and response regulator
MVTDTEEASYPPASILIVDDNAANLVALMAVLEALGHRVVKARSGEEALRRVMDEEFAAILVDVQMPGMDGFQTVSLLREHPRARQVPMVFLSAHHHDLVTALKGYAVGAIDYIVKPFEPDLLRAKVQSMVSLYRRGEELKRRAEIIAQKELEAAKAQAEAQRAEEASRLKDKYIGILGHDLRNPLSAIANSAQLLLRADDLHEKHKKSAARVLRAATRMSDMISDVLDFTRGHLGGGIPVEPTEGNLAEICHRVVDETKAINPQREIIFNATGDLSGRWDRPRLEQVISNLLGNAVRHGEGKIEVDAVGEDAEIALKVRNHGRPIPADQIPTIFEPFRRVSNGPEGLGLGLYIVKEIVRAHGGTIEVRSSADEGTTFACLWRRKATAVRSQLGALISSA